MAQSIWLPSIEPEFQLAAWRNKLPTAMAVTWRPSLGRMHCHGEMSISQNPDVHARLCFHKYGDNRATKTRRGNTSECTTDDNRPKTNQDEEGPAEGLHHKAIQTKYCAKGNLNIRKQSAA